MNALRSTRSRAYLFSFSVMLAAFLTAAAPTTSTSGSKFKPERAVKDANYDILDGKGRTRKEVQVIHWVEHDDDGAPTAEQMEIHVMPPGSLAGFASIIDDKDDKNPALVLAYRFTNDAMTQLIRRAPLTAPLKAGYHVYRDTSDSSMDKLILTNNELKGKSIQTYRIDPMPAQRYPSGHPLSGIPIEDDAPAKTPPAAKSADPAPESSDPDSPAQRVPSKGGAKSSLGTPAGKPEGKSVPQKAPSFDEDSGEIKGGFGL